MSEVIKNWQVEYGDGDVHDVTVPHSWRQDVDVRFEGPAVYSTRIDVPAEASALCFEGASYEAEVSIDGEAVLVHRGIWDAFEVPLERWRGKTVSVSISVVKNGGEKFPVKDVASGFLPFVYHTFGGLWGNVTIREIGDDVPPSFAKSRVEVEGSQIFVDSEPFYVRGVLHWGWYPELGHHNANEVAIRKEVVEAKSLGFNLIKFCLWVPPHRYLEILREEGMEAWLELPLWDPSADPGKLESMGDEIERIVRQYRHHDNIVAWTIGCELGTATPPEFRQRMVQMVKNLTGSPLVKDNSGGAEMYGGDLREFGDFFDYHPYCDTPFYPSVLDSLLPGSRSIAPVLLGEFNDSDVHRNLVRLGEEMPFWSSAMPELNDKGVRWQHDLPRILLESPMALGDELERHLRLMESSRSQALFIRKFVHEAVRARDPISGYVVTGIRDTPISTAGFLDDWGQARFSPGECLDWNGSDVLFLIPSRRPPWVDGGNRPGWLDPYNQFAGQIFFKVGVHSESGMDGGLVWRVLSSNGDVLVRGAEEFGSVDPLESTQVGEISWKCDRPGAYRLEAEFGGASNSWAFHVSAPFDSKDWRIGEGLGVPGASDGSGIPIRLDDLGKMKSDLEAGVNSIHILTATGTKPSPFWREAAYEFLPEAPYASAWERLLAVSGDRTLDPEFIAEFMASGTHTETLIRRIDVRTYEEAPVAVKLVQRNAKVILTTLRPHGGLGLQPSGVNRNAAGTDLLRRFTDLIK